MQNELYIVRSNRLIASHVWEMRLSPVQSACAEICAGQFVNIAVPDLYLRRPISVCNWQDGVLTIIYKVVGAGTRAMAQWEEGRTVDMLAGLGNGYDLTKAGDSPLLVGGGVGVPPLYMLARLLRGQGKSVRVVLGFNTAAEIFYVQEFRALGCEVEVTTADGSYGTKGFVTDARLADAFTPSYYYACGPLPMLRAVSGKWGSGGEISMEERMGCGFGACMGCSIETVQGPKRVCKEGPVFPAGDIIW